MSESPAAPAFVLAVRLIPKREPPASKKEAPVSPPDYNGPRRRRFRRGVIDCNRRRTELCAGCGVMAKIVVVQLLLFENSGADGDDYDEARDAQGECHEGYEVDAASAGGEFAPDDPVLRGAWVSFSSYIPVPLCTVFCNDCRRFLTYLTFKVPPSSYQEYDNSNC